MPTTVYMCFSTDMLHSGHIAIIKKAAKLGKPVSITMRIVAIKARRSIKTNHEIMRLVI